MMSLIKQIREKVKYHFRHLNDWYKKNCSEPVVSIIFTLFGNLFPLWFGWILLQLLSSVDVLNPFLEDPDFFHPKNFVVYSAAFLTSATYLSLKQARKNFFVFGLILITAGVISIIFLITSMKNNQFDSILDRNTISIFTWIVTIISFILFVFYKIFDYRKEHPRPKEEREQSKKDLFADFEELTRKS